MSVRYKHLAYLVKSELAIGHIKIPFDREVNSTFTDNLKKVCSI